MFNYAKVTNNYGKFYSHECKVYRPSEARVIIEFVMIKHLCTSAVCDFTIILRGLSAHLSSSALAYQCDKCAFKSRRVINVFFSTEYDFSMSVHLEISVQRTLQNPYGKLLSTKLTDILHRGSFQHANEKYQWAQISKSNISFACNLLRMI